MLRHFNQKVHLLIKAPTKRRVSTTNNLKRTIPIMLAIMMIVRILSACGSSLLRESCGKHRQKDIYMIIWERKNTIVALAAGTSHVIGLQSTGTIMCAWLEDDYYCGQCDTDNWRDIVAIAVGSDHSVGLRSDGRVFACGLNDCGQTNVGHWKDIIAIAAYGRHTIGLRADGIVVATGENKHGQCNIGGWKLFDDFRRISSQYDISCFGGS